MLVKKLIIFISFIFYAHWAIGLPLKEVPFFVENSMSEIGKIGRPHDCKEERFQRMEDLFTFVCEKKNLKPSDLQEMKDRGALSILSGAFKGSNALQEFSDKFNFFMKHNESIASTYLNQSSQSWEIGKDSSEKACRFSAKDRDTLVVNSKFSNLLFSGVKHMNGLQPSIRDALKVNLDQALTSQNADAILLEGYEYGRPLDCSQTLAQVLTPPEYIQSESDYLVQYGFMNKIQLIPADNNQLDDEDLKIFFSNDNKGHEQIKRDFDFMNAFHQYYAELLSKNPSALKTALEKTGGFSEKDFTDYYQQLNKRDLPINPNLLKDDFTPSQYSQFPQGTNRLADLLDSLRNRSLLRAIQISSTYFKRPYVVFGNAHLSALGNSLENYLGPSQNNFEAVCQ